jgi:hypothetical protein
MSALVQQQRSLVKICGGVAGLRRQDVSFLVVKGQCGFIAGDHQDVLQDKDTFDVHGDRAAIKLV